MRMTLKGFVTTHTATLCAFVAIASITFFRPLTVQGGAVHTTGLALTKSCPPTGNQGQVVMCSITVENQDPDHGVSNVVVTNQVPFPGGTISAPLACANSLAPNDANEDVGPDFTSCT